MVGEKGPIRNVGLLSISLRNAGNASTASAASSTKADFNCFPRTPPLWFTSQMPVFTPVVPHVLSRDLEPVNGNIPPTVMVFEADAALAGTVPIPTIAIEVATANTVASRNPPRRFNGIVSALITSPLFCCSKIRENLSRIKIVMRVPALKRCQQDPAWKFRHLFHSHGSNQRQRYGLGR